MLHDSFLSFCIFCFSVSPTDGKCSNNLVEVARETSKSVAERAREVKEKLPEQGVLERALEVKERSREQVSERGSEVRERSEEVHERFGGRR